MKKLASLLTINGLVPTYDFRSSLLNISRYIIKAVRPASWSIGKAFISGEGGLGIKSRAGQIG